MAKVLKLDPHYGYGWMGADQKIRETPSPFSIRVTSEAWGVWNGVVESPSHEFEGCTVRLTPRYAVWDGTVNVHLAGGVTGWASVGANTEVPC